MNSSEPKPATAARIYDYQLGGTHNFPADREAANAITVLFPMAPKVSQANRGFLRRAVSYLADAGVRQFLDIGSGIPTEGNVHEIAQEAAPEARVVYVDIDPVAVAEGLEILEGNDRAISIRGDVCNPRAILDHPQVRELLDFDQPIALLLVAVLHFVPDDAVAYGAVEQLLSALPPGSYLVLSHAVDVSPGTNDRQDDVDVVHNVYKRQTTTQLRLRTRAAITRLFNGLELVDPGVVYTVEWRPAPDDPTDFADNPMYSVILAGVGRLP